MSVGFVSRRVVVWHLDNRERSAMNANRPRNTGTHKMKALSKHILVALACFAAIGFVHAEAGPSIGKSPRVVEIDVTVTKERGNAVDLLSKLSMRTEKNKPAVAQVRHVVKFNSAALEIPDGVVAEYVPVGLDPKLSSPKSDQVVVTINDFIKLKKIRLSEKEEIELPEKVSATVSVPVQMGRTDVVKVDNYVVTVTVRSIDN